MKQLKQGICQMAVQARPHGSLPAGIVKRIIDLAMIVLLPLLMAEIWSGQEIHEWLGAVMLVLFLAHHLLNPGWWKGFAKGRYTPSRSFGTALDLLLLFDMAALCISGIMMSDFVFRFLGLRGGMIIARQLHLFHLSEKSAARTCILRIAAIVLSVYGLYAFIAQHMTEYLFLQTHFVLFDETKAAAFYFAETIAIMCLFAAVAYSINKLLQKAGQRRKKEPSNGRIHKAVAFFIPALVCVLVIVALKLPSQSGPWQENLTELPEKSNTGTVQSTTSPSEPRHPEEQTVSVEDGFVLIRGGSLPDDIAAWLKTNHIP